MRCWPSFVTTAPLRPREKVSFPPAEVPAELALYDKPGIPATQDTTTIWCLAGGLDLPEARLAASQDGTRQCHDALDLLGKGKRRGVHQDGVVGRLERGGLAGGIGVGTSGRGRRFGPEHERICRRPPLVDAPAAPGGGSRREKDLELGTREDHGPDVPPAHHDVAPGADHG